MSSLVSVITRLENLFSKFNEELFENQLSKPVITVSPDTTKGAYGWCTSWKAWKEGQDDKDGYYEINICAEYLNRPFENICGTMVHEMVHLLNLQNKVKDTTRSGLYHNKKFRDTAEKHGLVVDQDDKYGWCITKLNDEMLEFIKGFDQQEFSLFRIKKKKPVAAEKTKERFAVRFHNEDAYLNFKSLLSQHKTLYHHYNMHFEDGGQYSVIEVFSGGLDELETDLGTDDIGNPLNVAQLDNVAIITNAPTDKKNWLISQQVYISERTSFMHKTKIS